MKGKMLIALLTAVSVMMPTVAPYAAETEIVFEEPALVQKETTITPTDPVIDDTVVFEEVGEESSALFEDGATGIEEDLFTDSVGEEPAADDALLSLIENADVTVSYLRHYKV